MELRLTYLEINDLIEKKSGKRLALMYSAPHSVRVAYDVNILFKSTSVGLDLTVDQIVDSDIYISYNGGAGIDFMVRTALNHVKDQPGGELIEPLDGNRILLTLGRNAQVGSVFEHITLRDIRFDELYVIVEFEPKQV